MNDAQMIIPWITHHPMSASAILFGGTMIAVLQYTYLFDYRRTIE